MTKKLTVNTLAFGNLRTRKKQYTLMIIGIILATGVFMIINNCIPVRIDTSVDLQAVIITAILGMVMLLTNPLTKKPINPIVLIVISAVLGIVVYSV